MKRNTLGKGSAGRARRMGRIPGIFYGAEVGNLAIEVDAKELQHIIGKKGLIEFEMENGKIYQGLVREVQYHPIKKNIIHCDLFQVSSNEEIQVTVPLVLEGQPKGVAEGGILQYGLREIEVECLAQNIPEKIEIDISNLRIGDIYKVRDIPSLKNATIVTDPDTVIVSVISQHEPEKEEEEVAEVPGDNQEA